MNSDSISTKPRLGFAYVLLILAIITALIFSVIMRSPSVMIAFLSFGFLGVLLSHKAGKSASHLFIIVYCANVLIAIIIYIFYMNYYGTPYYYGGSDDLNYELYAKQIATNTSLLEYSVIRDIVGYYNNSVGYIYLVSILYRIGELWGGFNTMLPRFFNAMLLGWIAVITFVLARRNQVIHEMANNIALFVGLLPIMTFNAAHTFRDILVSLLIIWGVFQWDNAIISATRSKIIKAWLWTAIVAAIIWETRQVLVFPLLIIALVCNSFILKPRWVSGKGSVLYRIAMLCMLLAAATQITSETASEMVLEPVVFYARTYTDYRLSISSGISNYIFSAPLPISVFLRIAYGLIYPLPIIGQHFEELFQGAGTLLHFAFLPFLALGFPLAFRSQNGRLWSLSFISFYSASLFTFTSRHIVVFIPYAALIVAQGYLAYHKYRVDIWIMMMIFGVLMSIVYIFIKFL